MLIVERADAVPPPADLILPEADSEALVNAATGPYFVPFEILGESIVPGFTQVPLILQGTFIQITNNGTSGNSNIGLKYRPTVPFVASPSGGKIKLTANFIYSNLSIYDLTQAFVNSPGGPAFGFTIPAGGTTIVGLQYVATGLSMMAASGLAATEAAGNRGSVQLSPQSGSSFLVTGTVRQVFVNQQTLATIAAAAYSVDIAGGPLVTA